MHRAVKTLYQLVKELAGEHVSRPPIKVKDGRQAATHEQQMKRWQEHFAAVLNCPEPDVLHEFENDTEEIPTLEVNMEAITETESLVLSTLLYSADLWRALSVTQMKKLVTVHHKFQRRLLGIS